MNEQEKLKLRIKTEPLLGMTMPIVWFELLIDVFKLTPGQCLEKYGPETINECFVSISERCEAANKYKDEYMALMAKRELEDEPNSKLN